jgi:hypothetical protein
MSNMEIVFPFLLTAIFIYLLLLMLFSLWKFICVISYEYRKSEKISEQIKYYLDNFFVHHVITKSAQMKIIAFSIVISIFINAIAKLYF